MKLLNENSADDGFTAAIQRADIKQALDNYDFEQAYEKLSYSDYPGKLTKLLFKLNIDPLKNLSYIPDDYLIHNLDITTFTVPKHIEKIGHSAFFGCDNLKEVKLHSNINKIEPNTFFGCDNLSFIEIPASVKEICNLAFAYSGLEHISLAEGLVRIGSKVFSNCKNLKEIRIPQSVTSISAEAFKDCSGDLKVYIPKHLKSNVYKYNRSLCTNPNTV